jgi:hypothetical protein
MWARFWKICELGPQIEHWKGMIDDRGLRRRRPEGVVVSDPKFCCCG